MPRTSSPPWIEVSPASIRSSVVLPAPLRPAIVMRSPRSSLAPAGDIRGRTGANRLLSDETGTTLIVWVTIPEAIQVPGLWTIPHIGSGKSRTGGASNAGGLFLNWVDGIVAQADSSAADPRRIPVWSPYVRGERTPFHDQHRRAVLDGLDLTHDPSSLRRAAYEASGFVVRHLVELSGVPVSRVVATGGGTRVEPWMQAIADATGRPVEVSAVAEGAALGAAFLARMAVGLESSMSDAARWSATERVVEPDPVWAGAMQDRYGRFLELANRAVR